MLHDLLSVESISLKILLSTERIHACTWLNSLCLESI